MLVKQTPAWRSQTLEMKQISNPSPQKIAYLDLSALEGLEKYNDFGTYYTWELDLIVLNGHEPNNVLNNGTSEGDWYFNGQLSFDYTYVSPPLLNLQTTPINSTDLCAPLKALSTFTKPVKSSLMAGDHVTSGHKVIFLVPAKNPIKSLTSLEELSILRYPWKIQMTRKTSWISPSTLQWFTV